VQSSTWTVPSRMFKLRVSADHSPQPHHPSCKPEEAVARQPAKRVRGVSVSSCCERATSSTNVTLAMECCSGESAIVAKVSGRSTHTQNGGRGTGFSQVSLRTRISRLQLDVAVASLRPTANRVVTCQVSGTHDDMAVATQDDSCTFKEATNQ
jgi:hypothetical protein